MSEPLPTLKQSLLELLEETFETPHGYYLDRPKGGLFTTLGTIGHERASIEWPHQRSIAAHVEHTRFYVDALHQYLNGFQGKMDWDASWQTHAVTAPEWDTMQAALRSQYDALMTDLRALPKNDPKLENGMSVLAHTAYHFGAIRQLLLALEVRS
jgi:hypothetical protein